MSESGRETLPVVREWWVALPDVQEWSEVPPGSREALSDAREWSGGYPECLQVVRSPTRMSRSCWEALPDVRKWSKGLSRMSAIG